MKKKLGLLLVLTVFAAMIGGSARAALFFTDQFNYPDGDLTVFDGTGDNVSGGVWFPHSGTGNQTSVVVSSGQAVLQNGNPASEDVSRSLGTTQAGGTFYYGALVTVIDRRADPANEIINQDYFIHFRDNTTTNFVSRTTLQAPNNSADNATKFTLGIAPTSLSSGIAKWGTDLDFGQQYKIIASYEILTGKSDLWIDPVNSGSPSISITVPAAALIQSQFLSLRQDFVSSNVGANTVLIDGVAAGDSFDEVLMGLMIPEPSSMSLALVGLSGFFSRRRRLA